MDRRYQVFVSSTYADLTEERQQVIQALMEMDCIPAGMELFPAADEEQWQFIKRIIDDCDYYLLIIGGRYGSVTPEGISYTEKEFDYAVERGMKIVALIHGEPNDIPFGKSEKDPELRAKLEAFKAKVMTGRLVKFWDKLTELPGLVALSLTKTIKTYPATGWVRANQVASQDLLIDLNQVRKENEDLKGKLAKLDSPQQPSIPDIADFDSEFKVDVKYKVRRRNYPTSVYSFSSNITWRELFTLISPYLMEFPNSALVKSKISQSLMNIEGVKGSSPELDDQQFKTIGIQLRAYGLIEMNYLKTNGGDMAMFWALTKPGEKIAIESRVVRASNEDKDDKLG